MSAHFTPETMRFLRGLAKNNDRTWFEDRRPTYEKHLKQPLHEVIDTINTQLADFAPDFIRPPHKIAMRIFRDTRFSPNKAPYKQHLSAWWARQGFEKTSAPGFYLQIGPGGGFIAAGIYAPEREELLRLRQWLAEHHASFRSTLAPLLKAARKQPAMHLIEPNALTRNPKGFPPDHPASDLLRARNFGVSSTLTADEALQPALVAQVVAHFRRATPLLTLLQEPFAAARSTQPSAFRL